MYKLGGSKVQDPSQSQSHMIYAITFLQQYVSHMCGVPQITCKARFPRMLTTLKTLKSNIVTKLAATFPRPVQLMLVLVPALLLPRHSRLRLWWRWWCLACSLRWAGTDVVAAAALALVLLLAMSRALLLLLTLLCLPWSWRLRLCWCLCCCTMRMLAYEATVILQWWWHYTRVDRCLRCPCHTTRVMTVYNSRRTRLMLYYEDDGVRVHESTMRIMVLYHRRWLHMMPFLLHDVSIHVRPSSYYKDGGLVQQPLYKDIAVVATRVKEWLWVAAHAEE